MTNNEKLKAILATHQISASRCAEIISNLTQRPITARTVRSWIEDLGLPSARDCPDFIVEQLQRHFEKTQMLLPSTFMTISNTALTIENLNWVLKNAGVIGPNTLDKFKKSANHPLMKEESAYDDVPIEVLAAFVMEPYFPRKHFDRAFSWLFGKETISQIDAESFRYHEQLKNVNKCYSLSDYWSRLQFTQDEYCHIFEQFSQLFNKPHDNYLSICERDLKRHYLLTPEMYFNSKDKGSLSAGVCAEIADFVFDEEIKQFNEMNGIFLRGDNVRGLINAIRYPVGLRNLSMEKRNSLFSMFSVERFGLAAISNIYENKAIPDFVFNELLNKGLINSETAKANKDVLMDARLPLELATEIAFSSPVRFADVFFKRADASPELRGEFISVLTQLAYETTGEHAYDVIKGINSLIWTGLPTYPEVERILEHYDEMVHRYSSGNAPDLDDEFIEEYGDGLADSLFVWSQKTGISLPPALQDKLTQDGFTTKTQLQMYHDAASLVDAIKACYGVNDSDRPAKTIHHMDTLALLANENWTHDHLISLVHASRDESASSTARGRLDDLRKEIFRKLFSESVYPCLAKGELTGKYGRVENLLAHLLNGDADLLSEFDTNLIIHSPLQLDYADDEVNLTTILAHNPDINERIVAERLKLRMEHINDTPTLAPASQRRAL
ncbi:TPA: hypothetical protein RQN23_002982 [Aeromonas veronii]|nr:hypothetical protein [Aeromonas veronii]